MTKTSTIPNDTYIGDLRPRRFLQVEDLTERWHIKDLIVTVSKVQHEETIPLASDIDPLTKKPRIVMEPVLYFITKTGEVYPRGFLLCNRVNVDSLKKSTGALTIGELTGKRIKIIVAEHKQKKVLRISPDKVE